VLLVIGMRIRIPSKCPCDGRILMHQIEHLLGGGFFCFSLFGAHLTLRYAALRYKPCVDRCFLSGQIDKHTPLMTNMPEEGEEDMGEVSEERKEGYKRGLEMIDKNPGAFEYLAER
jgi:hypothetical protein